MRKTRKDLVTQSDLSPEEAFSAASDIRAAISDDACAHLRRRCRKAQCFARVWFTQAGSFSRSWKSDGCSQWRITHKTKQNQSRSLLAAAGWKKNCIWEDEGARARAAPAARSRAHCSRDPHRSVQHRQVAATAARIARIPLPPSTERCARWVGAGWAGAIAVVRGAEFHHVSAIVHEPT